MIKICVSRNQKGYTTIIAVLAVCSVLLIFISMIASVLWYREKSYVRIREAIKLLDVMEKASKAVRDSWDRGAATAAAMATPGATPTPSAIRAQMPPLVPDPSCVTDCQSIYGGATPALCYPNPDGGHAYCLYGNVDTLTQARLELKIRDPLDPSGSDVVGRAKVIAASYLITFFDKFSTKNSGMQNKNRSLASLLLESRVAYATSVARVDDVGMVPPVCPQPGSGCMTCGPGSGAICGMIYACPLAFSGCSTYSGGGNAAFAQEFYISPPGDTK